MRCYSFPSLSIALALLMPLSLAAKPLANPQQLLTNLQRFSGLRWSRVQAIRTEGSVHTGGLDCHFTAVTDLKDGRWRRDELCAGFSTAEGIDSTGAWRKNRSGHVYSLDSAEDKMLTVTDRWLSRIARAFPKRSPAKLRALSPVTENGVTYERLEALPSGGSAVTLWVDTTHHWLSRTVMVRSLETVITRYGDYGNVDEVDLPGRITTSADGSPNVDVDVIAYYQPLSSLPPGALDRPSNEVLRR